MDGAQFDQLTRQLATGHTRRSLLGGLVAGAFGLAGLGRAGAAICRDPGRTCSEHAHCCSGLCGPRDATLRRCHCQSVADCPPASVCQAVACQNGICITSNTPGIACDDGNACTVQDTCSATGKCVGTPVVCTALDQCHVAGTCNPATGVCSNPNAPDGTACDDGDASTETDTCQGGVCTGSIPDTCAGADSCFATFTCNNDSNCTCWTKVGGGGFCGVDIPTFPTCGTCESASDCAPGQACIQIHTACCESGRICLDPCGSS